MHGYGDFDCSNNKQTAILIENYLINEWLPLFKEEKSLNQKLLNKTYKEELKNQSDNLKFRKELIRMQQEMDPSGFNLVDPSFEFEFDEMASSIEFMNDAEKEKNRKKIQNEERADFYGDLSESLDSVQYNIYHHCREHSLIPKGNQHVLFNEWVGIPTLTMDQAESVAFLMQIEIRAVIERGV